MNSTNSRNNIDSLNRLSVTGRTVHSILVMDDEKIIRDMAASVLKHLPESVTRFC